MRKRKEELVREFSKQVFKLTSVVVLQSAGELESSDCIGNSKHVHTYSSQHFSVEKSHASIGQQTENTSVKHIHEGESYVNSRQDVYNIKSHLVNENKITKVEQRPSDVNEIQQKFNIQADNVKYTAIKKCQKIDSSEVVTWAYGADDIEEKYVFSVNDNNTVSQPCQNYVQCVGSISMCRDADTVNHTNHSDLGSENWVITLNKSMGYNSITTSAKVEGAECLSNHNTYIFQFQFQFNFYSA